VDGATLWFIIGGIILVAFAVVGVVAGFRRQAALSRSRDVPRLEPGSNAPAGPRADLGEDERSSVGVVGRGPDVVEDDQSASDLTTFDVTAPEVERPEAPQSRLARLRRRLAGSNSALSRGLLLLLSRDRGTPSKRP
jgi:fused signal recognition particle receptor